MSTLTQTYNSSIMFDLMDFYGEDTVGEVLSMVKDIGVESAYTYFNSLDLFDEMDILTKLYL